MTFKEIHINNQYVIAGNPDAPAELLEQYAHSTETKVRARVAENKATPIQILIRLLQDTSAEVKLSLSTNEGLPRIFLAHLATDADPDVRIGLAENARMPVQVLQYLTQDENPYVSHRASITLNRLAALIDEAVSEVSRTRVGVSAKENMSQSNNERIAV